MNQGLVNSLIKAIQNKNVKEIDHLCKDIPLADIAKILESIEPQYVISYFQLSKNENKSEIFGFLNPDIQKTLVLSFSKKQIDEIVGELYSDEIADLIEDTEDDQDATEFKDLVLSSITDKETRKEVQEILQYGENQTGSVMNVNIVPINQNLSISNALDLIKKNMEDAKLTHHFFVVDNFQKLVGSVSLEALVFATKRATKVKNIMTPVASVIDTDDKEIAAQLFADHDKSALPVVDKNKHLIGMITADDVIDVISEAATEDVHKMAGIISTDDLSEYSKISIFKLFKSRFIWLMFLMVSATVSQIVLDAFQGISGRELDKIDNLGASSLVWTTAIVAILPVISGAAGNASSQASTMVIRALATGDITRKDYLKVFLKEFKVANLIGFMLGITNFGRLVIYYAVQSDIDSDHIFLSLAASIALFVVIILAKVSGGLLPLAAKTFKLDPAVMAAPLLTTIIDALSTMIFFAISIGVMSVVL